MKPSSTKNTISSAGYPYVIVELGDILFFGGKVQKYLTVDNFKNERPCSGDIDLISFEREIKVSPIVFEL